MDTKVEDVRCKTLRSLRQGSADAGLEDQVQVRLVKSAFTSAI